MTGIIIDSRRERLTQVHRHLLEWGRWSSGGGSPRMGYGANTLDMRAKGRAVGNYNMEIVEWTEFVYTTWHMLALKSPPSAARTYRLMLQFVIKIHYCEPGTALDKAHHTGRKFNRKISRSLYYTLLGEAREALATLLV